MLLHGMMAIERWFLPSKRFVNGYNRKHFVLVFLSGLKIKRQRDKCIEIVALQSCIRGKTVHKTFIFFYSNYFYSFPWTYCGIQKGSISLNVLIAYWTTSCFTLKKNWELIFIVCFWYLSYWISPFLFRNRRHWTSEMSSNSKNFDKTWWL